MKIKILGTKGEIPETSRNHAKQSGVLIDETLLLDVGEKSYLQYRPKWILITHFHPDHAYFVRHKHEEVPDTDAQIFAPEKPKYEKAASKIKILDKKRRIGPYRVTPIPTHHSKNVKSQAYLIQKGKASLLYTGDLVWLNKEYHPLFQDVDLIITEASFMRKGGMVRKDKETGELFGHNGIPNLMHLFKHSTKKILFVHFGSWFYKGPKDARKKIAQLGKENGLEAILGYDGMDLEI